jgi:hypothetical protein
MWQMAAQFLTFLETWIEIFPEYKDDDVFSSQIPRLMIHSFILLVNHTQGNIFHTLPQKSSSTTLHTET